MSVKQTLNKPSKLSPNQILAWNLQQLREARGWSQDETAHLLEPYLGYKMSRQALCEWEKSILGNKIHRFDADEITALARLFEIPIGVLFGPPSYFKGRVVVNGKPGKPKAKVRSTPLTPIEMLGIALPKRDERLQRAAEAVHAEIFAQQAFRAVLQYISQDRALAERAVMELFRSAASNTPSPALVAILRPLHKRFLVDQGQRIIEEQKTSTPHGEAAFAKKVFDYMKSKPDLRSALREDADDMIRRVFGSSAP
jgi:transcriptional regulator with XRE-family HTH domain